MVTAGPAAAKKVVATGSVTCHVSQTFSFNPPLSGLPAGNPGYAMDVVTVSAPHFSQCTGTTNALPSAGAGTKTILVKWKGIKILGGGPSAGSCQMLQSLSWAKVKPHLNWSASPVAVKGTKISNVTEGPGSIVNAQSEEEQGFVFSGVAKGSFVGTMALSDYFEIGSASSGTGTAALNACKDNVGTVSSLTTDPTTSTITVGTTGS